MWFTLCKNCKFITAGEEGVGAYKKWEGRGLGPDWGQGVQFGHVHNRVKTLQSFFSKFVLKPGLNWASLLKYGH